jgi:hypothetical protein
MALSPECFQDVDYRSLPQAVGMITHAEPYWLADAPAAGARGGSDEDSEEPPPGPDPEIAAARLRADLQSLWSPEANLAEQLSWYELGHSHLNFPLRGAGKVRR